MDRGEQSLSLTQSARAGEGERGRRGLLWPWDGVAQSPGVNAVGKALGFHVVIRYARSQ